MKGQQQEEQLGGVEGINPSGQNPCAENPNGESPGEQNDDASLVRHPVKNADHHMIVDESYFNSFPPGYRFKPHDGELVVYYLLRKILNQPLPPNQIRVVELYRFNPNTLTERYKSLGEMEWYFFTPRDRKYRNGLRPNRAAADGYWKATGADKPVKHQGNLVGFKKALVFYKGKAPKGDKTNWIMHEYIVNNPPPKQKGRNDMRLDDWVLCRIYKKTKQSAKAYTRKRENSEEDQQSRSEVATQSQDSGQVSVDENTKMLPKIEMFKPEGLGIFDVPDYYNQGRFFSAYDNVLLYSQSPYANFQNGHQGNSQNWLPSIPQSGFQQMLHHNPTWVADQSPMKPEQFGYLPEDGLFSDIPLEDNCFDPLPHNFTNF